MSPIIFTNNLQFIVGRCTIREFTGVCSKIFTSKVVLEHPSRELCTSCQSRSGTTVLKQIPQITSTMANHAQTGDRMQLPDVKCRQSTSAMRFLRSFLTVALLLSSFVIMSSQPGHAIPAFARKYGLPFSALPIRWPLRHILVPHI